MIDYLSELKYRIDILPVGNDNVMICCPFHDDHSPSCGISLSSGVFNCFSCHERGPFYKLIAQLDSISVSDAKMKFEEDKTACEIVQSIESDMQVEQKKEIKRIKKEAFEKVFPLRVENTEGMLYLRNRRISRYSTHLFNIRYGTKKKWRNRVILPIRNIKGSIVNFTGRLIYDGKPKTKKFRKGVKDILYGLYELHIVRRCIPYLILVEGEFDAIFLQQEGLCAVAVMGTTGISAAQIRLVLSTCLFVFICYDSDEAGKKASKHDYADLRAFLPTVVIKLPKGKDPNDLTQDEVRKIFSYCYILN